MSSLLSTYLDIDIFNTLPPYAKVYLFVVMGLLGLVMGSALNCLSYRIAHNQEWSGGRSVCPSCQHTLATADLVPLFSWIILKGKCRYCGQKISTRYPISEALLALIYISLLWKFGLTLELVSAMVFCSCLFCLSLVDLEIQIIPDRFLIIPAVVRVIQLTLESDLVDMLIALIPGLVLGGSILILSIIMDKVLKKETMGGGDIKLLALIGLFLSEYPKCIPEGLLLLLIASVVGIIMGSIMTKAKTDAVFPFGPALALSAWFILLFGSSIADWYTGLLYVG